MLIKLKTNYRIKTTNGPKVYKIGEKIDIKQAEAEILIKIGAAEKTEKIEETINKVLIPSNTNNTEDSEGGSGPDNNEDTENGEE